LTSDGIKQYKKVANFGIKTSKYAYISYHEYCGEKVKRYLKRTKDDTITKMSVARYLTEINNAEQHYSKTKKLKTKFKTIK
jgi:hypothetical protein